MNLIDLGYILIGTGGFCLTMLMFYSFIHFNTRLKILEDTIKDLSSRIRDCEFMEEQLSNHPNLIHNWMLELKKEIDELRRTISIPR